MCSRLCNIAPDCLHVDACTTLELSNELGISQRSPCEVVAERALSTAGDNDSMADSDEDADSTIKEPEGVLPPAFTVLPCGTSFMFQWTGHLGQSCLLDYTLFSLVKFLAPHASRESSLSLKNRLRWHVEG